LIKILLFLPEPSKEEILFSFESFDIKLDTDFIGRNFVFTEEADSTNSSLLDKANKYNTNGTVFYTEKQLKGRGRKNRPWYSAKDLNLTFSILLNHKKYISENPVLLNFAASLAVGNALENLFQLKVELKWPNDVLINGKKICGILIESTSESNKIERLVIGLGINVNQTVFQGAYSIPPTSVRLEINENADRERLLADVLNNFEELLKVLIESPAIILKDWKQRCSMIGDKISITEGDEVKYGILEDVDDNGFLLLRDSKNRIEKIHYGDVSLR
jgi:BirA family transcriptional regulator, biotin operon repressor / biotin---[acetyl-CoA-carboxylase] ligase